MSSKTKSWTNLCGKAHEILVLITGASSEGSDELAHSASRVKSLHCSHTLSMGHLCDKIQSSHKLAPLLICPGFIIRTPML